MAETEKRRGRPAVWGSARERQQAYREREAAKARLLHELLHAVRNARLETPELHREVLEGSDAEVLQALIRYYRARHWCRYRPPSGD